MPRLDEVVGELLGAQAAAIGGHEASMQAQAVLDGDGDAFPRARAQQRGVERQGGGAGRTQQRHRRFGGAAVQHGVAVVGAEHGRESGCRQLRVETRQPAPARRGGQPPSEHGR